MVKLENIDELIWYNIYKMYLICSGQNMRLNYGHNP